MCDCRQEIEDLRVVVKHLMKSHMVLADKLSEPYPELNLQVDWFGWLR